MTGLLAQAAAVFVAFAEPGFPAVNVRLPLPEIPTAVTATSVQELDSLLEEPGAVLVWRHGSAFPIEAWGALQRFLRRGGGLLHLGGAPFSRPVSGAVGRRVVEPESATYLKILRLNQAHPTPLDGGTIEFAGTLDGLSRRALPAGGTVWSLEPKLAGPPRFAGQEGSPGRRDGTVRPLGFVHAEGGDERFPLAAGGIEVEWSVGPYAGGRWLLRLLDLPAAPDELARLMAAAAGIPGRVNITPVLGTYHGQERPALDVRWYGAAAADGLTVRIADTAAREVASVVIPPDAADTGRVRVTLDGSLSPGLYRATVAGAGRTAVTGFWVFDPDLFASGDTLDFDGYTLRRNGRPAPVIGTTVMSRTVHRDFLHEPDAAVWDDTFAELATLDIGLVRTGVWAGWDSILRGDSVDESWLRALEAYYLTARRHGIGVLFTFFAFIPPAFDGDSPYFSPASLASQRALVGGIARRFAPAREILWDLINEPSIASPRHVWLTRPNGDSAEARAFERWLRRTYPGAGTDTAWRSVVRRRWRLPAGEPIGLPTGADFDDVHVFGARHPYRARDYIRFSQDAFGTWAGLMRATIRAAGSTAAITVGQDEGGLIDRPSPLLHHDALEFTSIHTWWFNDALLWDAVMARVPGKPLLVSETGIMRRERLSGLPVRSPETAARLLQRKLAYAFAAGAFGAVEWVYDVNPYLDSDNEVAIGLRRADGSYKPEHAVLRRFAAFVRRTRDLFEEPEEPSVLLLVPSGDQYSPRGLGGASTRRAVATLAAVGAVPAVVSEHRTAAGLPDTRLIVLPATRGIADSAWQAVRTAVDAGATLLVSGHLEGDDAGLPAHRLGTRPRPLGLVESLEAPWIPATILQYPLDIVQSVDAAVGAPSIRALGHGQIIHYPVPLEWAFGDDLAAVYEHALIRAAVPAPAVRMEGQAPGAFLRALRFRDAILVIVVNERGTSQTVRVRAPADRLLDVQLDAGATAVFWVDRHGELLDAMDRTVLQSVTGDPSGR